MKSIKFMFLLACLSGISVLSFAMTQNTGKQTRTVQHFDKISVSTGVDLYLTQGNNETVVVEANSDIIDKIITEVKGGTLNIYIKKNNNERKEKSKGSTKVFVTFTGLTKLSASAGSDVNSQNPFNLKNLIIESSSGADITIGDLTAESVSVSASSGSDAKISGKTTSLKASSSSGSDLDCSKLVSVNCDVSVSSGSNAAVNAAKVLNATASSGAKIVYFGSPEQKTISYSSGGSVKAK